MASNTHYLIGDAVTSLNTLDDESVHFVMSSPP